MCVVPQYKVEKMKTAAVNILVTASLQTSLLLFFFFTKFLEVELLNQMVWTFYGFQYILPICWRLLLFIFVSPCLAPCHCLIDICWVDEQMNKRRPPVSSLNESAPFEPKSSSRLLCGTLFPLFFMLLTVRLKDTQLRAFTTSQLSKVVFLSYSLF